MKKKKLTLRFSPTFELDVTNWYEGERLTIKEKVSKLKEDFSDISVFMQHASYENLVGVDVGVIESPTLIGEEKK